MSRRFWTILFSSIIGSSVAVAEAILPGEMSFLSTVVQVKEDEISPPKLGFVVSGLNNGGILYERPGTSKRHQYAQVVTGGISIDFGPEFTPSPQVGRIQRDHRNLVSALAGIDQKLWVFGKQRDYAITGGLGLGIQYIEYTINFYPGVCPNGGPCLPNFFYNVVSAHESKNDWSAILRPRIGYRIYDTRAAGIKSDVTFLVSWNMLRYPGIPKITGPDGVTYDIGDENASVPLMVEFSSAF